MRNFTEEQVIAIVEELRNALFTSNKLENDDEIIGLFESNIRKKFASIPNVIEDWSSQDNKLTGS